MCDHIALSVADLDAWVAKLRGEGVTFLEEPYRLGATRAVMIEGPSREALELVEVGERRATGEREGPARRRPLASPPYGFCQ